MFEMPVAFHADPNRKHDCLMQISRYRMRGERPRVGYSNPFHSAVCCDSMFTHGDNYPVSLGFPSILADCCELLSSRLPPDLADRWIEDLVAHTRPGADLWRQYGRFVAWLLLDRNHGVMRYTTFKVLAADRRRAQQDGITRIAAVFAEGSKDLQLWKDAYVESVDFKRQTEQDSISVAALAPMQVAFTLIFRTCYWLDTITRSSQHVQRERYVQMRNALIDLIECAGDKIDRPLYRLDQFYSRMANTAFDTVAPYAGQHALGTWLNRGRALICHPVRTREQWTATVFANKLLSLVEEG